MTHTGSRSPLGRVHLVVSNSRHLVGAGSEDHPAPDASRVDTSVRGNVVNLAARSADIHQLPVAQVGQGGAQFLAIAPLLKASQYLQMRLEAYRVDADVRSSHVVL